MSDDTAQTPELVLIGRQARRNPGATTSVARPGTPGPVTFATAALTLSLEALPDHAHSVRAYRRPAGGQPEVAGESTTTTASVVDTSPLTPTVTYELWLVGTNAQGEGPESNHITHLATWQTQQR